MTLTLITFVFFTALVAVLTWWFTRDSNVNTNEGYFLAGRSLTGVFIAGSLLLTNLSTEQLIGLNAGSFRDGLSVMCWEVQAGLSLVILALFFLPRYLKSGIATIPEFLEIRYDLSIRTVAAVIFIVAYMLILLPFVLYLGATGLNSMLGLSKLFGLSDLTTIWLIVVGIAVMGSAYAVFGGLRAIAVSDTFNGAGLLIGGLMISFFSLQLIATSEGGFSEAFAAMQKADVDAFQSLGTEGEGLHWPTLFSGVLLINFFYWCTNQQIIQRTFAAKSLAEGQKGVLLAACFKIFAPLILVLPGIMAAYLVLTAGDAEMVAGVTDESGQVVAQNAYGALVARVLPEWLLGFFAAVIVGSILSTFNSVLNSAATLFSLDVYKVYISPQAKNASVVRAGKICSLVVAVFAAVAAPLFFHGREQVFGYFQSLNAVYFIPLLAIILVGMFHKLANGTSAMITLLVGLVLMLAGTFLNPIPGIEGSNWIEYIFVKDFHYVGAVFVILVCLQIILADSGMRREQPYEQKDVQAVDLTPWKPAPLIGGALVVLALAIYAYFAF